MKEWDYYIESYPAPRKKDLRRSLSEPIDNQPMTAKEREAAYKELEAVVDEQHKANMKLYREKQSVKDKEFYRDARKEIGYDRYLDEEGCQELESFAYQAGHAYGYSEIFNQLIELDGLIENIRNHIKPGDK